MIPTPPIVLVLSCSLNPTSKSHRLAEAAVEAVPAKGGTAELIDLRQWDLPMCDGRESFGHPSVQPLTDKIEQASAILLSSPVYNYDLSAAAKNAVEMTGRAWQEKPVGFLCVAGGASKLYVAVRSCEQPDVRFPLPHRPAFRLRDRRRLRGRRPACRRDPGSGRGARGCGRTARARTRLEPFVVTRRGFRPEPPPSLAGALRAAPFRRGAPCAPWPNGRHTGLTRTVH